MKKYLCCLLLILPSVLSSQIKDSAELFADYADEFVAEALDSLDIPALSFAIVKNDKIVYLRGFGMPDMGKKKKTDPETLFYIASCTKSYTGLTAALLNSKDIIRLGEPLSHFFPEIKFDPSLKADSITLRHLLTHTSGIQNDGIVFRTAYSGEHTFDQLVSLIAASEVNKAGFGNFKYDNLGYNAYSLVLTKVLNKKWQDELLELIFEPLKMQHTTTYASHAHIGSWETARPHSAFGVNGLEKIQFEKSDATMHAAGGMYSSVRDLTKWLRVQLNNGVIDGTQIFPDSVIRETHRLQAVTNSDYGPFKRIGYGLGWYIGLYDQDTLIHHFGGFPGYYAHISFMPDKKIGIVILVNENMASEQLSNLLSTLAYDWWLGKPKVGHDYKLKLRNLVLQKKQISEKISAERAQRVLRKWQLTVPFEKLTGSYEHSSFGVLVVKGSENSVSIAIAGLSCVGTPFKTPNSVRVELIPGQGEVITFNINAEGEVFSLQYAGKEFLKNE